MSQLAKFVAQVPTAQRPIMQAATVTLGGNIAVQFVPQVPQFWESTLRSVQMPCAPPPQRFCPGGHTRSQLGAPPSPAVMQSKPGTQALPHAPQLFRSRTSTHAPLQSCCPEGQARQTLLTQLKPVAHPLDISPDASRRMPASKRQHAVPEMPQAPASRSVGCSIEQPSAKSTRATPNLPKKDLIARDRISNREGNVLLRREVPSRCKCLALGRGIGQDPGSCTTLGG